MGENQDIELEVQEPENVTVIDELNVTTETGENSETWNRETITSLINEKTDVIASNLYSQLQENNLSIRQQMTEMETRLLERLTPIVETPINPPSPLEEENNQNEGEVDLPAPPQKRRKRTRFKRVK